MHDTYLTLLFGSGMKVSDIENCLELTYLADVAYTHYSKSIDYSDEELLEYREANPDSFSGVDYVKVVLASSDFTVFDEDGVSTSTEDEDKEAAAAEAEKFNQAQTVEEFKTLIAEYFTAIHEDHEGHEEGEELAAAEDAYTRHALKTDLEEDVATWAFSAKVGETKVVKNDSGTEITVYMLAKTAYIDETLTRNVRHILFSTDSYEDDTKAKEVYAEWEADEFSDGKFVSLEYLYNEDTGSNENAGEYENLAPGATVAEFDAWLFDEEREVGDHDIVETSYGWHIMQYLGESDVPAWQAKAKDYKASDDYQTFITAGKEKVTHNHDIISGLDF